MGDASHPPGGHSPCVRTCRRGCERRIYDSGLRLDQASLPRSVLGSSGSKTAAATRTSAQHDATVRVLPGRCGSLGEHQSATAAGVECCPSLGCAGRVRPRAMWWASLRHLLHGLVLRPPARSTLVTTRERCRRRTRRRSYFEVQCPLISLDLLRAQDERIRLTRPKVAPTDSIRGDDRNLAKSAKDLT